MDTLETCVLVPSQKRVAGICVDMVGVGTISSRTSQEALQQELCDISARNPVVCAGVASVSPARLGFRGDGIADLMMPAVSGYVAASVNDATALHAALTAAKAYMDIRCEEGTGEGLRSSSAAARFASAGGVVNVTSAMDTHQSNGSIQLAALQVLSLVSIVPSVRQGIVDGGGLASVLTAMARFPTELPIQMACARICWELPCEPRLAIHMYDRGVVDRLLDVLDAHADNADAERLVAAVVGSIKNFAAAEDINAKLAHQGIMERLFSVTSGVFHESAPVMYQVMLAFRNMVCLPSNQARFLSLGGPGFVMAAMARMSAAASVQEGAACLLRNLSSDVSVADVLLAQGVADRLVATIGVHLGAFGVVEPCLLTLANLACARDGVAAIFAGGGLPMVHRVLDKVSTSRSNGGPVQAACCTLLRNLAFEEANAAVIMEGGETSAKLWRLLSSTDSAANASVVVECFAAITNLAVTESMQAEVFPGRGLKLCVDVMARHPEKEAVVVSGLHLVMAAVRTPGAAEEAVKLDFISKVIAYIGSFAESVNVLEASCRTLTALTFLHASVRGAVFAAGGVSTLMDVTSSMSAHPGIVGYAVQAISNILFDSAERKVAFMSMRDGSAVEAVLALETAHPSDARIVQSCCGILWGLAMVPEQCERLRKRGCVEMLHDVLARFPGTETIRKWATNALQLLE